MTEKRREILHTIRLTIIIIIIIRIVHEVTIKKASKHYNTMQKILKKRKNTQFKNCLLYTSDAADE